VKNIATQKKENREEEVEEGEVIEEKPIEIE